jgi:hypothetical protein
MKEKTTTEKLIETLDKSKEKFQNSNLVGVYEKMAKLGIPSKTEYTFPPKDTIGKTFHEQIQFSNQGK